MVLLLLLACASPTDLSFVVISDDSALSVPVTVAGFAGFRLDNTTYVPESAAPRWLPAGLTVSGGDTSELAVRFEGEALGLRGATASGTPFSMHVAASEFIYGAASLDEPDMVLVLDVGQLISAEELDAESLALDPDPNDQLRVPVDDPPDSERALSFVDGAPGALWLGTPQEAENRYLIHWPFTREQLGVQREQPSQGGCGSDDPPPPLGPIITDTALPDTADAPAETAWAIPADPESSSGCGSSSSTDTAFDTVGDTRSDSTQDTSAAADTATSSGGCSCSKGDDSGDTATSSGGCSCSKGDDSDSVRARSSRRWLALAAFFTPLVLLRRRR